MINIIEAPNYPNSLKHPNSLFLAGGITNCSEWAKELIEKISDLNINAFNPKRQNFNINDKNISFEQINWEHTHLKEADMISFWFDANQIQPITLFELGRWSSVKSGKKIFVGCHPDYPRKQDVEIQLQLKRPNVQVVYSLDDLANQIKNWITKYYN